jgi:hypothetical protein
MNLPVEIIAEIIVQTDDKEFRFYFDGIIATFTDGCSLSS